MSDQHLPDLFEPERQRSSHLIPWITVGLIAVLAIVASAIIVNIARGAADSSDASANGSDANGSGSSSSDSGSGSNSGGSDKPGTTTPDDEADAADQPPAVEIGQNPISFTVPVWDLDGLLSQKFGTVNYRFVDAANTQLVFESDWINSLPDSCAAQRAQFGLKKTGEGKFEALRPVQGCTANPTLFNEIWGQFAATAKTLKPTAG